MALGGNFETTFLHRHDWAQPLIERLTWATEVLRAGTGLETRTPLRLLPRRTLTYFVGHSPLMRALVADWAERNSGMAMLYPLSQYGVCILRPARAGTSALTIPENAWTGAFYRPSFPAVTLVSDGMSASDDTRSLSLLLWDGGSLTVSVLNEDPGVLYLDGALTADVPAGAVLLPLRQGRCVDAVTLEQWAGGWAGGSLTVRLDTAYEPSAAIDPALDTLPVWPDGDWADTVSASAQSALTAFDFSQADVVWRRDDDVPMSTFTRSYTASGQAAQDWLDRLYTAQGRAGGFWLADGLAPDMTLAADAWPGATALPVTGAQAAQGNWLADAAVRVVSAPGATGHYRCGPPIGGALDVGGGTTDFHRQGSAVTRLLPCRLDADAVELGWIAPQTLQVQLTARRISPPVASGGGGYY